MTASQPRAQLAHPIQTQPVANRLVAEQIKPAVGQKLRRYENRVAFRSWYTIILIAIFHAAFPLSSMSR